MSPPISTLTPDRVAESTFLAIGTSCSILVTDPATLDEATGLAKRHLDVLDRAASRFRPDSELMRLAIAAEDGPTAMLASVELADYLRAALLMAELTDGLVDPTVGRAMVAAGYDADIDQVRARGEDTRSVQGAQHVLGAQHEAAAASVPGWRSVSIHDAGLVRVPRGCLLDLGATAKAHAADTIARRLAARLAGGFLVNLGGDIAISGDVPADGWRIGVQLADGREVQVVRSDGAAVCTSSTQLRTWRSADGTMRHHIIDPRTGASADAVWASVTCVAPSALVANAMSTAAIVLGHDAPAWLEARDVTARLDGVDGTVKFVGGWPKPEGAC